jgi:hypothetical protein
MWGSVPTLMAIAGPNGSEKSTLTRSVEFEGRDRLLLSPLSGAVRDLRRLGASGADRSNSKWWGRYDGTVITLSENEERLVVVLRALPPDAADQVITWATRLRDLATGRNVNWSATWTEEDLADVQRASLSRFDERERE